MLTVNYLRVIDCEHNTKKNKTIGKSIAVVRGSL